MGAASPIPSWPRSSARRTREARRDRRNSTRDRHFPPMLSAGSSGIRSRTRLAQRREGQQWADAAARTGSGAGRVRPAPGVGRLDPVQVAFIEAKPAAVLALLLMNGNRRVSSEALMDALWGEKAVTRTRRTAMETHVCRLRKVLEPGRAHGETSVLLVNDTGGYRLLVDPEDVDSEDVDSARFVRLAGEAEATLAVGRHDRVVQWPGRHWTCGADARTNRCPTSSGRCPGSTTRGGARPAPRAPGRRVAGVRGARARAERAGGAARRDPRSWSGR
jgi:hypothetical protein